MQNSWIIFQKLLVLFGFMFIGYLSYKKQWITDHTESQLSGLVLNIFNPALIISGVVGSSENGNWTMVLTLSLIHISEPTRRTPISYAVFCLKKKKKPTRLTPITYAVFCLKKKKQLEKKTNM